MNKKDLVDSVAELTGVTKKDATLFVKTVFDVISVALHDNGSVNVHDFGKFKTRTRGAQVCRNPKTGESVDVPARNIVSFRPSKALKEAVNKP